MDARPPEVDRRTFLQLLGAGVGISAGLGPGCASTPEALRVSWIAADGQPTWTPPGVPLPAFGDGGSAASDAARLASFEVRDELLLPEGFKYDLVAGWGDRFGAVSFGTNADFTALVAVPGRDDEFWLVVNHEAVSARPWLQGYLHAHGEQLPRVDWVDDPERPGRRRLRIADTFVPSGGFDFAAAARDGAEVPRALREVCSAALGDLGVSVLHVQQRSDGSLQVLRGSRRHARFSGTHATTPTFGNCSGGVTPWGSVLSGEENYQDYVRDAVDARGEFPQGATYAFNAGAPGGGTNLPSSFSDLGAGLPTPLDGRDFGWICEIDPAAASLRKLRRLGRMRHENAAVVCAAGAPLVVYEGDDRCGGHLWRYESAALALAPSDPANSRLFDAGTLFVARFAGDGSGRWVALTPDTPLVRPRPEACAGGFLWVPDRRVAAAGDVPLGTRVRVCAPGASSSGLTVDEWVASLELACGKPFAQLCLGDLVWPPADRPQIAGAELDEHRCRVLELEAFAMANAVGATPGARPEDVELNPADGSLFIAFTDAAGSGDGSPDTSVFPDAQGATSRRYGGIVRVADEATRDGRARTFRWSRFLSSGELHESGGAFGCPDNLTFDPDGNLWMTCDLDSASQNAAVDRQQDSRPGDGRFKGVFGNNALFYVPTRGPGAGQPVCFAVGPCEAELTGPTFSPDGRTLVLAVQHPGEIHGTRGWPGSELPLSVERCVVVAARDGTTFEQRRSVPLGSNWPASAAGIPPRSCVVSITRVD